MSGGGQVSADISTIGSVSKAFGMHYTGLQQAIQTLQNNSDDYSAKWDGATKAAYAHAMTEVNNAWNALNNVLQETTSNISTSGQRYSSTDDAGASKARNVDATTITSALNH